MKKFIVSIVMITCMIAVAHIPAGYAASNDKTVLVIAVEPDYFTFDPGYAYELYAPMIIGVVYDNLFEFLPESDTPVPQLAEGYQVSSDGKEYVFTLRKDATFSSGNPVTAADVKFSFDRALHLKSNASALLAGVISTEVVDSHTLKVTLEKADSAFIAKTTSASYAVVDSKVVKGKGGVSDAAAPSTDTAQKYLDTQSAGSGPYILKSFTPDDKLILVRNEKYWGKLPAFKMIIIQDMPDENAQLLAVKNGDIDIAFNLSADQLPQLENAESVDVIAGTTMTMGFLLMNRDPAIGKEMADINVQKAVRYAVDYAGLQMLIGKGTVTPQSFIQVGFLGSGAPVDVKKQTDLTKAKSFLAASAYPKGFATDITVCDLAPEGIPLTLIAEKIKADLSQIGIELNIVQQGWGAGFGDAYREGTIGFTPMYWGPDYYDPNTQLAFLPGQYVGQRAGWTKDNSPELAATYAGITAETDNNVRKKMIEDVVSKTAEDSPFVVYAQYPKYIAASKALKNIEYSNIYRLDLAVISK